MPRSRAILSIRGASKASALQQGRAARNQGIARPALEALPLESLSRRIESTNPRTAGRRLGQHELQVGITGIQQQQQSARRAAALAVPDAQAAQLPILPIELRHFRPSRVQPGHVFAPRPRSGSLEKGLPLELDVRAPQLPDEPYEIDQIRVRTDEAPVDPGNFVILAVRIVVAPLRTAELIARLQHRHALREEQGGQKVAHLALAQSAYGLIARRPFDAAIPAQIVVVTVGIVFQIGLIVALVVGDQIGEREAVVRRDEVDSRGGLAGVMTKNIARARKALGEFADGSAVAAPKGANRVAVAVVPLGPAGRKSAELVAAEAEVPRLGDQLGVGKR